MKYWNNKKESEEREMIKGFKKVTSYVLATCMLASGILVNIPTMKVLGAPAPPTEPETETIGDFTYVYGNGFPLLIEEDTNGKTVVYWDKDGDGVYDDGDDTKIAEVNDAIRTFVVGGGKDITVESAKITMKSGYIGYIYGGGFASQGGEADANVTEDVNIKITGGTVNDITGGGKCNFTANRASVGGTINIDIENELDMYTLIGGTNGCGDITYNTEKNNSTVHDINITIKNVSEGTLKTIYGSGRYCNQEGNTSILIENSTLNYGDSSYGTIYGGIEAPYGTDWTTGERPKKVGDVTITLDNVTFKGRTEVGHTIYGGGYGSGIDGNVTINVNDSTNIENIYGGGKAEENRNGIITKDVEINISGDSYINHSVSAGGSVSGVGQSAYVEGEATIDISGTTTIGFTIGMGLYNEGDVSVKKGEKIYVSDAPHISIFVDNFVDNKVIVKGELTEDLAEINLLTMIEETGTVVVEFEKGITVNEDVFFCNMKIAPYGENNIIVDIREFELSALVMGVMGVALTTDEVLGSLKIEKDSFTGITVGDDITSWFSDAASLGITVKVKSVKSNEIGFTFNGTPNKAITKNIIVTVPKTKLLSAIEKQSDLTRQGLWYIMTPANYDATHTLTNIKATNGTAGVGKVSIGNAYITTLTANTGYKLPNKIVIKLGGEIMDESMYTYDKTTGKVTIPGNITIYSANIEIIASGEVSNDGDDKKGEGDKGDDDKGNGEEDKSTLGDTKKEVKKDEKSPEMSFNNKLEELENLLFTEEEKEQIKNGAEAKIYLEIKDVSDTVSEEDKLIIKENIEDFIIGEYIDISLFKKIGDIEAKKISNPNGLISITIIIPESLKPTDSSKTRNY